ncbi:MAG: cytochrome c oxidase subunit II [Bauldia sp.]|nr:cytochrome c oxidase subunit II [Bauldia sp.]
MTRARGLPAGLALALAGCTPIQSALDPAGSNAGMVFDLGVAMTIGATLVCVLVVVLAWRAVRRSRAEGAWLASPRMVIALGAALPAVVLTALLAYGFVLDRQLAAEEDRAALTVRVTGEQWWWRVAYLAPDGSPAFETANEIRLPVGQPVRFELESADVIHSFWVPALGGKIDLIPGRTNTVTLLAEREGIYRGQCAEFCGTQHALMAFMARAETLEDFGAWFAAEGGDARQPETEEEVAGHGAFVAAGCGACHAVRGTTAAGTIGPDLTHVGSRLTIAAGTLPNHAGTLAAWVTDAQAIKPGARMPSFDELDGPTLRSIAVYLASLR